MALGAKGVEANLTREPLLGHQTLRALRQPAELCGTCDEQRRAMVTTQIAARGMTDPAVLAAMRTVPREAFVIQRAVRL